MKNAIIIPTILFTDSINELDNFIQSSKQNYSLIFKNDPS